MAHSTDYRFLPIFMDRERRFWLLVEKTETCWLWRGFIGKATGYGHIGPYMAHRFSYQLNVGPIPRGMQIDHLCRVRNCVNPEHLEVVTPRENNRRSLSPTAVNARKTHCIHGHEFTPENIFWTREGWRRCKVCVLSEQRASRVSRRLGAV